MVGKIRMDGGVQALSEQNTMLQLNSTLLQLSQAVQNLEISQREANVTAKMDPFLMQNQGAPGLDSEYSRRSEELRQSEIAGIMRRLTDTQQQLAQANAKIQQNQALLYSYQSLNDVGNINTQNASAFFDRANAMSQNVDPTLGLMQGSGSFRRYFGEGFNVPGLSEGTRVSFPMQQALMDRERLQIQAGINVGDPDPSRIRQFYEYQTSQFETAQKAFANYAVSQKMGIKQGIDPTEFERGYLPGLTKFSETLGTDMDTAIEALTKLKDLEAVTSNIRSGTAASIAMGIDEATNVITRLSQLMNSNDLTQLIDGASRIAQFGFGDFNQGMQSILTPTPGRAQSPVERMQSFMQLQNDPAFQQLGYNRAGFETALFRQSTGELGKRFGNAQDPMFQYLGGAQGISNMATNAVTGMIQSGGFFTAMQGGGNAFQGAMQLSDEMVQDPTSFLMNMGQRQFQMRQQYGGQAGFDAIRTQVEAIRNDFPVSEDEALLMLAKGNPAVANSIKQVWKMQDAEGEEIRQRFSRAYQNFQISGGAQIVQGAAARDVGAAYDADFYREAISRGGRFDTLNPADIARAGYTETIGRLGKGLSSTADAFKNYLFGSPKPERFDLRSGGMAGRSSITVAEDEYNFARAASDMQNIQVVSVDANRGRGVISSDALAEMSNTSIILQAILTDKANERIDEVIRDEDISGMINAAHIKEILSEGLIELRRQSFPEDELMRAQQFIEKASLNDIYNRVRGNLSADNKFNILLKRAMGIGALDTAIFGEKALSRNVARTTFEAMGLSEEETSAMVDPNREYSRFRQAANQFFGTGAGDATAFGAGLIGGELGLKGGAAIGTAFAPGIGTAIGGALGAVGGGLLGGSIGAIGDVVEGIGEISFAIQEQFGDAVSGTEFFEYVREGEEGTLIEKEIKRIVKFIYSLWEAAGTGVTRAQRRVGFGGAESDNAKTDIEKILLQTSVAAKRITKSVKKGENPGTGMIDEVAETLMGFYTRFITPNDDIKVDQIKNLIKLILRLMTGKDSEIRIVLESPTGLPRLQRQVRDIIMKEDYIGGFDYNTEAMDTVQNMIKFATSAGDERLLALTEGIRAEQQASVSQDKYEITELQSQFLRNLERGGVKGDLTQRLIGGQGTAHQDSVLGQLFQAVDDPDMLSNINVSGTELESGLKTGFGDALGSQVLQILQQAKREGEGDSTFNKRKATELARVFEQFGKVGEAERKEITTEALQNAQLFKSTLAYLSESPERETIKEQLRSLGIVSD